MGITLWSVTYLNDDVADDFGTKLFTSKRAAEVWAEEYESANNPDSDGCEGTTHFTTLEMHEIPFDIKVVESNLGVELDIATVCRDKKGDYWVEVFQNI